MKQNISKNSVLSILFLPLQLFVDLLYIYPSKQSQGSYGSLAASFIQILSLESC